MSGVEKGAAAPIDSFALAATQLAERINLAKRDKRSRDMVTEVADAVEAFLDQGGIASSFGNAVEGLVGIPLGPQWRNSWSFWFN